MKSKKILTRLKYATLACVILLTQAQNCDEVMEDGSVKVKEGAVKAFNGVKNGINNIRENLSPKEEEYLEESKPELILQERTDPPELEVCNDGSVPPKAITITEEFPQIPPIQELPKTSIRQEDENTLSFEPNNLDALKMAMTKFGGNPKSVDHTACFIDKHYNDDPSKGTKFKYESWDKYKSVKVGDNCKMVISDYTMPASELRMFIIDRCKGSIKRTAVAQGAGRNKKGRDEGAISEAPNGIGNKSGDNRTPRGFMVMGALHTEGSKTDTKSRNGKSYKLPRNWYPGMKLHGLQTYNNTSHSRGILLHRALYTKEWDIVNGKATRLEVDEYARSKDVTFTDEYGRNWRKPKGAAGTSLGCSAVAPEDWPLLSGEYLGTRAEYQKNNKEESNIARGPVLYNFGPLEEAKENTYCGEALWTK